MKPINPNLWPREIGNGCLCEFPPDELNFRHQFDFLQISALTHSLSWPPDGGTTKCRTLINPPWLPPSSQNCSQRKTKLPPLLHLPQVLDLSSSGQFLGRSAFGWPIIQSPPLTATTAGPWPANFGKSSWKYHQWWIIGHLCTFVHHLWRDSWCVYCKRPVCPMCQMLTFPQFLCLWHVIRVLIWT